MPATLIIPGLKSSGPAHWQSWMEKRVSGAARVEQRNWNEPNLPDWASRVRSAISQAGRPAYLVAHSFGALAAIQAASDYSDKVAGALLVAPADPDHFDVAEFLPHAPLPFSVILAASTNDPWMSFERARDWSERWGAEFINLGRVGHVNVESGFGPWPKGLALLELLKRSHEDRWSRGLTGVSDRTEEARERFRSALSSSAVDDVVAIRQAAALLEDAGWSLREPKCAFG